MVRAGINRNPFYNQPVMGNEFPTQSINAPLMQDVNDFDPTLIDKRNITVRRKKKVNSRGVLVNQYPENDQLLLDKRRTRSRDRSNVDEDTREEKNSILSDSICKPINMNEFNRVLKKRQCYQTFLSWGNCQPS